MCPYTISRKYNILWQPKSYKNNCSGHLFSFEDFVLQDYRRRDVTDKLLFDSLLTPEENVSAIFFNALFKAVLKANGNTKAQLHQLLDINICVSPHGPYNYSSKQAWAKTKTFSYSPAIKSDFTDKDESNLQEFELQKYFNDMLVY